MYLDVMVWQDIRTQDVFFRGLHAAKLVSAAATVSEVSLGGNLSNIAEVFSKNSSPRA